MLNTRLKTAANNEFGKDVFKLVINSVFRSPSKILGKKRDEACDKSKRNMSST